MCSIQVTHVYVCTCTSDSLDKKKRKLELRAAAQSCICWRPLPTHTRPVVRMSRKHTACSAVGVVDRCGKQNTLVVTFVGRAKWFRAYWSQFSAEFYGFVVLTSRLDAQISRSGDFPADRRQTKPIALPLAHAHGVKIIVIVSRSCSWTCTRKSHQSSGIRNCTPV